MPPQKCRLEANATFPFRARVALGSLRFLLFKQKSDPPAPMPRSKISPTLAVFLSLFSALLLRAQDADSVISVRAPVIALTHAKLIDGRGTAAREDQTIVIRDGRIAAVGAPAVVAVPAGAQTLDLTGKTVLPGLVMLHEHLFFTSRVIAPFHVNEMDFSFPRLYLACGLTSIRTGGSIEPYTELELKARIDRGAVPGPKLHLTAPYLEGFPSVIAQLHPVDGPDDAAQLVNFWAGKGFTSFKLYMHLPKDAARAAIDAAHRRGLKITGHIGALTYREAAELGIDNLEHGFYAATDFVRGKQENELPSPPVVQGSFDALDVNSPEATALIQLLVEKHVALTSTLPVFEASVPGRPILTARELDCLSAPARENYLKTWARINGPNDGRTAATWKKMLALEKKFFTAGGLLVAGTDPTGYGATIAGHGSLHEVELLVEAGLTPVEAIQVASYNGARFLGVEQDVGSVEPGKAADLVVVAGDPAKTISDLRKIETVFKDGVGYDSQKLLDSVKGCVGIQ
jgi:imidazolonepropionase-like amidohydrolase